MKSSRNQSESAAICAILKDQSGGSLIEFVIIAPVLFVILFGIIEFGILLYDQAMITNASREGARAGIVFSTDRLTDDQIRTVVRDYCEDHLITFGTAALTIPITRTGAGTEAGDHLTVRVNYPFQFLVLSNLLRLIGGSPDNSMTLSAESVMRLE